MKKKLVYTKSLINVILVAFMILYVDDILLIGNYVQLPQFVKESLENASAMKDLGGVVYILWIKIYRDRSRQLIGLSKSTFLDKVLNSTWMQLRGVISHVTLYMAKQDSESLDHRWAKLDELDSVFFYSQIDHVHTDLYLDWCLLCSKCYEQIPGRSNESHWMAVKNIPKYLRMIMHVFLIYGSGDVLDVMGYTYASFQTTRTTHDHDMDMCS